MYRYGTAGLLGLMLLSTAGVAHAADIPGNTRTKAVITPGPARFESHLERRGDSDWYRVTLKAGRNYAFEVASAGCTRMNLRNAAGKVLRSDLGFDDEDGGFEFRSATTKTFFVEYVDANKAPCIDPVEGGYPTWYSGNVAMDVRGDATTRATIAPGQTIEGFLNWYFDKDYFRATLEAGKGYLLSVPVDPSLPIRESAV
jgi:serralysin